MTSVPFCYEYYAKNGGSVDRTFHVSVVRVARSYHNELCITNGDKPASISRSPSWEDTEIAGDLGEKFCLNAQ